MTQPNKRQEAEPDHETAALAEYDRHLGRVALFEEVMQYVDSGHCTFDEAMAQYKHDLSDPEPLPDDETTTGGWHH